MLQKLSWHPNIIKSLEIRLDGTLAHQGMTETVVYNVIELAENGSLSKYIRFTGSIEEELARLLSLQL